jgi:hypothetical protein
VSRVAALARAELPALCAFFGGVVAQEVVKATGKYMPLRQWLYLDAFEVLPDDFVPRPAAGAPAASLVAASVFGALRPMGPEFAPAGSRYDHLFAILGRSLQARVMAQRLCDLVTGKLLDVRQVFKRLDPDRVAELLTPGVDRIAEQVVAEMVPSGAGAAATAVGRAALRGLPASAQEELSALRHEYVAGLTRDMQRHVKELLDVDEVVVGGMVREKQLLVELFRRCGRVELDFLVNSGFGFGCLLGVVQMCLWIFYELPWTLAAGGAVVGYLTNWIALLLIFALAPSCCKVSSSRGSTRSPKSSQTA